ncbi:MAG: hypothetical protein R3E93_05810 [Thiothrix sp.]
MSNTDTKAAGNHAGGHARPLAHSPTPPNGRVDWEALHKSSHGLRRWRRGSWRCSC